MAPEGRQSPPPETQRPEQGNAPPAEKPNFSEDPSDKAEDAGKDTLANLESNPEHILAKASEEKTSKKNYVH
jgi:hypothetical protein